MREFSNETWHCFVLAVLFELSDQKSPEFAHFSFAHSRIRAFAHFSLFLRRVVFIADQID